MATKTTGTNDATEITRELEMAFAAATYVDDKKAENVVILDVRGISPVTDYYVICTVSSMPQLRAVSNEIKDRFWEEMHRKPLAVDEKYESLWVIHQYGEVMVHIFHEEKRAFYDLESLWGDSKRVAWEAPSAILHLETEKKVVKKVAAKKAASKKVVAKKAPAKKVAKKKAD